tara:strand:+ start:4343 stop:4552 length:210 start_codon:yes stop_codon:yes gene_type:complete
VLFNDFWTYKKAAIGACCEPFGQLGFYWLGYMGLEFTNRNRAKLCINQRYINDVGDDGGFCYCVADVKI